MSEVINQYKPHVTLSNAKVRRTGDRIHVVIVVREPGQWVSNSAGVGALMQDSLFTPDKTWTLSDFYYDIGHDSARVDFYFEGVDVWK